ncbi:MAG: SLBB domain-containing protein, partial [Chitinophagaceae bacterium]
ALQRGISSVELAKLRARLSSAGTSISNKSVNTILKSSGRGIDSSLLSVPYVPEKNQLNTVFGSELFNNPTPIFEPNLRIATPKNYSLGPDDELAIDIFGYQEANYRLTVSPEGSINIPYIGIIPVVGLTVEQATKRIKDKMTRNGYAGLANGQTQLQVSIAKIRSIKVTIIGEVKKPGSYSISSLSTLFNALYVAGGPTQKGSFRQIELIRNNKLLLKLDAYDFLLKGDQTNNVRLTDQDVIRIPSAVAQVTLVGEVKRNGIFELLPNNNLQQLIDFAGGFTNDAYTASFQVKQVTEKERRIKDIANSGLATYFPKKGDSIFIGKILDRYNNSVSIKGAIYRPGTYELEERLTLLQLIQKAEGLKDEALKERGIIIRTNEADLSKQIIPFDVKGIVSKAAIDIPLKKNDEVVIGSADTYQEKFTLTLEGEVKKTGVFPYFEGITLSDLLFLADGFTDASANKKIEIARRVNNDTGSAKNEIAIVLEASASKDLRISGNDVVLKPWDLIVVRKKPSYQEQISIKVEGEVKYPGNYVLTEKNERVSSLIQRSGGLTPLAFREAASLIRVNALLDNEDKEERIKRIQRQTKDTSLGLVNEYVKPTVKVGLDLQRILNNPNSDDDVILQEGDVLVIPKQKNEIRVSGEVMMPSEIVFKEKESLQYYINKAGGFTDNARAKKLYVLYPNGAASKIKRFLFFKKYPTITAGAEILVPKIPERQRNGLSTAEIIGLTSAMASLAGVVIAVLR